MDEIASADPDRAGQTLDWQPSRGQAVAWQVGAVALTVVGVVGYALLAAARFGDTTLTLGAVDVLLGLGVTILALGVVVVAHEAVHGAVMLVVRVRPQFGFGVSGGVLPYAYATAPGIRFTRSQYLAVAFAPTVVVNLAMAGLVWWAPWGGWMVVVAALHLGGCIGDWVLAAIALQQPRGSRFEDLKDGIRVHLPPRSIADQSESRQAR